MSDLLYGRNAVREALRARRRTFQRLLVSAGAQETGTLGDIVRIAGEVGVPVERLRDILIDKDIVWEAATRDVPALRKMIEHLVHMLEPANSSERRDS